MTTRSAPQPDAAAACRLLASGATFGTLATAARDPAGHPFATLVALAFDPRAQPLLLLSDLAEHTKNLRVDARASLLVVDSNASSDPLAGFRMTLVGSCIEIPTDESDAARGIYLGCHPEAASYARFADFTLWRLDVASVRWIAGFGRMQWLSGDAYAGAKLS